jgi:hypothetical protein
MTARTQNAAGAWLNESSQTGQIAKTRKRESAKEIVSCDDTPLQANAFALSRFLRTRENDRPLASRTQRGRESPGRRAGRKMLRDTAFLRAFAIEAISRPPNDSAYGRCAASRYHPRARQLLDIGRVVPRRIGRNAVVRRLGGRDLSGRNISRVGGEELRGGHLGG